jgi:outer membrane biosynthesis protein TonB
MTTTNALIGSTLALIIVAVALAAGRYLPAGWAQRFRRMIPQSTIDKFKNDPLGSVTAMVKDPKSVLKSLKIPDSVMDIVPQSIKDNFMPTDEAVGVVESEPEPEPERKAAPKTEPKSEPKVDPEPERKLTPTPEPEREPIQKVVFEPEATTDAVLPRTESHEAVELGGVIVQEQKEEIRNPITLQISADDLAEIQSMLAENKKAHAVV